MAVDVSTIINQHYANAQSYANLASTSLQTAMTDAMSHFNTINPATISWDLTVTELRKRRSTEKQQQGTKSTLRLLVPRIAFANRP